jgi:predicted GH43/DUF377 family glycosyl hydrolase
MKRTTYVFLSLFILFLVSCSEENINITAPENNPSGKVLLKIDREKVPSNVVQVTAFLFRAGYDTLQGTLNILSSNSAEILLQSIPTGIWHLRVEAKNENGVVVYAGETEVTIQENFTTLVNLTLIPTSNGVGNIHIIVTWGTNTSQWMDYFNNPVLVRSSSNLEYKGVNHSPIFFENNQYKMWYTSISNDTRGYVWYAVSSDGINWMRPSSEPVLRPSLYWDSTIVSAGAIIKEQNEYRMYYSGFANNIGKYQIGLATSTDGINWVKRPNPILVGGANWDGNVGVTDVLKVGDTYYLFYHGYNSLSYSQISIGLATSGDGINWTKYSGNPILVKTQSWEGAGPLSPSVIFENGKFEMVYSNTLSGISGFGFATSLDGKNWTKAPSNPFFTKNMTANNWANQEINYPVYRKFGSEYRIYYTGFNVGIDSKIGFTKKVNN